MSSDHRAIHSPEYQTGMHLNTKDRPACWTTVAEEKGQVVEGWPAGVKPGIRNPFHLNGIQCGNAMTEELWETCLWHTPLCSGCARGR